MGLFGSLVYVLLCFVWGFGVVDVLGRFRLVDLTIWFWRLWMVGLCYSGGIGGLGLLG